LPPLFQTTMIIFSGIFKNTAIEIDILRADIRNVFPASGIMYILIHLLHFKLFEASIYALQK
jgi:hypothetical protein